MRNKLIATFGGGCFWCIEAIVQRLNGVEKVVSGYAGGHTTDPSYRSTSSGTTGHAEVIQVTYYADVISYDDLITIFMTSHDPTTLNSQGADHGSQYRSIILYHDIDQKKIVERVFQEVKDLYDAPIVTELSEATEFYIAEVYHQDYYNSNPNKGYCRVVIDPKIAKLRNKYSHQLKLEVAE